jgi:HNH endonuclease
MKRQSFTQEEILAALKMCARKLGRSPNKRELQVMTGITEKILWRRFGSLGKALEAAGLDASGRGFGVDEATLLLDWAGVVRKLGKIPSVHDYRMTGTFSHTPFSKRYGSWSGVGRAFRKLVERDGGALRRGWKDVLAIVARQKAAAKKRPAEAGTRPGRLGGVYLDRPTYGAPLLLPEMAHAPTNELGVMFLFGALARRLGFVVHRIRGKYPDCIAVRETAPGVWQRVRIEFEFDSRNFVKHRHRKDGCDLIVCWRHGWKDAPEWIEVVELSKVVG